MVIKIYKACQPYWIIDQGKSEEQSIIEHIQGLFMQHMEIVVIFITEPFYMNKVLNVGCNPHW